MGKSKNPKKNNHAWTGLPPRSSQLPRPLEGNDSDHGVVCIGGGFLGSRMWKIDDPWMDGACGEIKADMGMDP
jgi:hypothetical protein